jgi:predicted metal-binding transcription factor (methanogenesis marker protein 9)
MTKPIIRIHDLKSDQIIDREMTDDEYKVHQQKIDKYNAEQAEAEAKATQKAALLERLGITEDEARLLLG